jgi:phosphoribosylformimino-5-aminoimidazole carboxamide ribonucleotide (ProFAR) isomerase
LLAYRAYEADPLELVRAARQAFGGQLVAAGNVATTSQITDLWNAGVDAFTIGSAAFAGALDERSGTLEAQLRPVIDVLQQLAA